MFFSWLVLAVSFPNVCLKLFSHQFQSSCFQCLPFFSIPSTTRLHLLLFGSGFAYLHGSHLLEFLKNLLPPSLTLWTPEGFTTTALFWSPQIFLSVIVSFSLAYKQIQISSVLYNNNKALSLLHHPVCPSSSPASFPIKYIHGNLHPQLTPACLLQDCPHHCPFKGHQWMFLSLPLHLYLYPSGVDPSECFHMLIETYLFTHIHIHRLLLNGGT